MNINFSTETRRKITEPHIISRWELIPCHWLKRWTTFPQAPREEFPLSNRYVRGTVCFLSQEEWTPRGPDSIEGRISLQWLKFRLVYQLTRWRHVWIPCGDPRESRKSPPHLDRGPHIPLTPREAHGIPWFKGDDAWLFLKIYRNINITVLTRKGRLVSRLTSRSVRIVLPSLVYIHVVSVIIRQDTWHQWTNLSLEWPFPL